MISDLTKCVANNSIFLENEYDEIYVVCLGEKKFALNSTAYFLATNFLNQSVVQLIGQLIEHFSIDASKRNEVEIECKECIEMLIKNKILLISEIVEE